MVLLSLAWVSIPGFNNIRPYGPLFGLTPAEAFSGIRPDKNRFSDLKLFLYSHY